MKLCVKSAIMDEVVGQQLPIFGMWLSLVERCVRDAEVAGSNPVTSTIKKRYQMKGVSFLFISMNKT